MDSDSSYSPKVDRSQFKVVDSKDPGDKKYWLSRSVEERLEHIEYLRRMNYGDKATERLQRVFKIFKRTWD